MISHIHTFGLSGIRGFCVDAEIHIARGLPDFHIIGMGNTAVKEAGGRIRAALETIGCGMPLGRITVNLAPAGVRKEGACYDLAIAMGILRCTGFLTNQTDSFGFIGELSMDGFLRPVKGVLSMIQEACRQGIRKCIVPLKNADEAAMVSDCAIYPAASLPEAIQAIGEQRVPWKPSLSLIGSSPEYGDFCEVKGQQAALRAAEIAASGGHNLLFLGAPGCGKTMIAERFPGLLPSLSREDALEVTPIYSLRGMLSEREALLRETPFREVYPDITTAGLIGGGNPLLPGEISLAHKGVLFLDELTEFDRSVVQSLRQPLESGKISLSRSGVCLEYPAEFLLLAAANPCRCGRLFDGEGACSCTPQQARHYLSRISRPILDRIDIQFPIKSVDPRRFTSETGEHTKKIRGRVLAAREIQRRRYQHETVSLNGRLRGDLIRRYCELSFPAQNLICSAMKLLGISVRGGEKVLKLARTITDMKTDDKITKDAVAEALQYRFLDRFLSEAV